ncbi:MAG: response regulator transcription factor [Desulfobulbaceae bacterium]|nr:response regulator transcription factor [Desulfobulbaceae bacterium]
MSIVCISQDHTLINDLVLLYGRDNIVSADSPSSLPDGWVASCEVMIVDLNSNKVPAGKNVTWPIIALSAKPIFHEAVQLLQYGIKGYGNRKMRKENLAQVVESVKNGQLWMPPAIITQLLASVGKQAVEQGEKDTRLEKLSKRELEMAGCVAEGMSNQEMADKMFVSLRTVKAHLSSIYSKTGFRNRLELGLYLNSLR